jgi:hypothetical protein
MSDSGDSLGTTKAYLQFDGNDSRPLGEATPASRFPRSLPVLRSQGPALPDRAATRSVAEGQSFTPRPGVPSSRAECRDGERPCPYVRCKWHLWLVLGSDRPGRRYDGRTPPTALRPAWLEDPMPPCCTLDIAERAEALDDPGSIRELAAAIGLKPSRIHDIIATALAKLRERGMNLQEFVGA